MDTAIKLTSGFPVCASSLALVPRMKSPAKMDLEAFHLELTEILPRLVSAWSITSSCRRELVCHISHIRAILLCRDMVAGSVT